MGAGVGIVEVTSTAGTTTIEACARGDVGVVAGTVRTGEDVERGGGRRRRGRPHPTEVERAWKRAQRSKCAARTADLGKRWGGALPAPEGHRGSAATYGRAVRISFRPDDEGEARQAGERRGRRRSVDRIQDALAERARGRPRPDRGDPGGSARARASTICADAIAADGLVHLFGTGHSRIPVEELFPRYGSYPGFHPLVELSLTYHTDVVGTNGQRQAMFIERVEGLADVILQNFELGPPDAMVVFSASGLSAAPIEMARGARLRGLPVIAVTSREQSLAGTPTALVRDPPARPRRRRARPLHAGRRRARGARRRLDAGRTGLVIGRGRARERAQGRDGGALAARGALPPVLTSAGVVGAEESRRLFDAAYAEHARRVARVLQGSGGDPRRSDRCKQSGTASRQRRRLACSRTAGCRRNVDPGRTATWQEEHVAGA